MTPKPSANKQSKPKMGLPAILFGLVLVGGASWFFLFSKPTVVDPTPIVIFEGLHPMYDDRVNAALDLTVYLDITDEVKFAWKAQRDIAERGATMEEVQKAIDGRKPDFAAYVEPQKAKADIIVQVLLRLGARKLHLHAQEGLVLLSLRPDRVLCVAVGTTTRAGFDLVWLGLAGAALRPD